MICKKVEKDQQPHATFKKQKNDSQLFLMALVYRSFSRKYNHSALKHSRWYIIAIIVLRKTE